MANENENDFVKKLEDRLKRSGDQKAIVEALRELTLLQNESKKIVYEFKKTLITTICKVPIVLASFAIVVWLISSGNWRPQTGFLPVIVIFLSLLF